MPVVPSAAVPSVAPVASTGIPYQSASGATPDAFGAQVGAAEQRLGAQVEQTSDVLAKHAIKMQEELNTTVAKDLFLKGDVEVGKLTVEYNSLEGLQKVAAYDQHVKDIEAVRERLKKEAPNADVAKKFDQDFARRVGYSIVDGARGAATANKQVQKQTNAAVRANTLSMIASSAEDDTRFDLEMKAGLETFKQEDEYRGQSPEVQAYRDREYVTAAWATRLDSMSKNDPLRSRDLLDKVVKDKTIDGGKALQLKDTIDQRIIQVDSRVSADKIIQSGVLIPPELREAVKKFEGYVDDPKGKPDFKQQSSGYGTKVEPGDEKLTPEQRRLVYEQRLDNGLARAANIVDNFAPGLPSGTRNALISLTYNAGSAWTSAGLGQSIRAGDMEGAQDRFNQYIKAGGVDNEALIQRRMKESTWFGGEPRSGDPLDQQTEAMNKAKERAIQVFPDDPANQAKYLDTLQNRIRADQSLMESAARKIQLDMRNTVQKELVNDQSVTTYDRLSPQAKQAYDQSPPTQQDVFNRQMKKNATVDVPLTPERQNLFEALRGESKLNPEKFMSRNITELDLPRSQKSMLSGWQEDRKALLQRGEKLQTLMSAMGPELREAGISQSNQDTNKQQQYNRFGGMLDKAVEAFENEKQRKITDAETREIGKGLLREVVLDPGIPWVPFTGETKRAFEMEIRKGSEAADFELIPKGSLFRHTDGSIRRKP